MEDPESEDSRRRDEAAHCRDQDSRRRDGAMRARDEAARRRAWMVASQIAARGISDARVLAAMETVPREAFIPQPDRALAYEDGPLPIGEGQTISQPLVVAMMAEAMLLTGRETVLEVGTGSGYAAAVLSHLAARVYTVERIGSLAARAQQALAAMGYANVTVRHADGTLGWAEHAPYDAILVSAAALEVPAALLHQMAAGGRLVIPVGSAGESQSLLRITRTRQGEQQEENLGLVRFVPLVAGSGPAGHGHP